MCFNCGMARHRRKTGNRPRHSGAEFQISPAALRFAVPALIALFSLLAWFQRGVYEDGFIYLRVAENLAEGRGFVYNPGERYETNTDFLWSVLLGLGIAAGVDSILAMHVLGVAIFASALFAAFAFARKLFSGAESALVALVLLGGHFTFVHFAATGFAPALQALAALCCLLALARFGDKPDIFGGTMLGFALFFLALCRLDSVVFGLPLVLCAVFFARRNGARALSGLVFALAIPSVLFGGVLLWKWLYYGDVFPATYYAKAAGSQGGESQMAFYAGAGVKYVADYWKAYFFWIFAPLAVFGFMRSFSFGRGRAMQGLFWTVAAMCALWHAYMLRIGGGYYEFRFLAAQAPLLMILLAAGFNGLPPLWRRAATCGALALSLLHGQSAPTGGVFYVRQIEGDNGPRLEISGGFEGIELVSDGLADVFKNVEDYHPQVKAAGAGGLMSWRKKLLWVEPAGYADPRIGKADLSDLWYYSDRTVGHRINARPKWMARHGVNLMVDAGTIVQGKPDFAARPLVWAAAAAFSPQGVDLELPPDSQLFALPLRDGRFSPVLYFNRNETIDRVLDERGIERVNVF